MLNILSYIGVSLQSEVCLWTLLGLIRTIFDATLFKVNANLKQVWQMSMPEQLSMPGQRAMRTIISGVMLVQCFTVYVYLATYIVILYPVFLEERPSLLLPWLLLAAVRNFLCELTSLALGLAACVLLGAARPPCVRFIVFKLASITPAFYMWMLVFSYYSSLKVAASFKSYPVTLTISDHNYGLELAVRRRRTKSLQGEALLRKNLVNSLNYGEEISSTTTPHTPSANHNSQVALPNVNSNYIDPQGLQLEVYGPFLSVNPLMNENLDQGGYEEWCGIEIIAPRDTDRILEQFSLMMLRIAAYLNTDPANSSKLFSTLSFNQEKKTENIKCTNSLPVSTASSLVNKTGKTASNVQNYPDIFMKKASETDQIESETKPKTLTQTQNDSENSKSTSVKVMNRMQDSIANNNNTIRTISSENLKSIDPINETEPQLFEAKDLVSNKSNSLIIIKTEINKEAIKASKESSPRAISVNSRTNSATSNLDTLDTIRQRIKKNVRLLHERQQNNNTNEEAQKDRNS